MPTLRQSWGRIRLRRSGWIAVAGCALSLLAIAAVPSCARTKLPASETEHGARDSDRTAPTQRAGARLGIAWLPAEVVRFEDEIIAAAKQHGVDAQLVAIFVMIESKGNPTAKGPGGASGLMQIMPQTGTRIANKRELRGHKTSKLLQPSYNLDFGAWYIARLAERFDGPLDKNVQWIAAAYNAGPGKVAAFRRGETKLADRTNRYRRLVAGLWRERNQAKSKTYELYRTGKF